MYKKGIRWTEYMTSKSIGDPPRVLAGLGYPMGFAIDHDEQYMVIKHILTIPMNILMVFIIAIMIIDHPG